MSQALKKCCQIIGIAFEQAYKVLDKEKIPATIDIKIMVFRNYNSPYNEILEGTAFENTSTNLKRFLDRVQPSGGLGN